jgi:NAD-dependent SIR2 family protein deacetylase
MLDLDPHEDPMKKPKMPPSRLIRESEIASCHKCGSSMMRKRFLIFGERSGCIQPECENYGGRNA